MSTPRSGHRSWVTYGFETEPNFDTPFIFSVGGTGRVLENKFNDVFAKLSLKNKHNFIKPCKESDLHDQFL
jgi:hypothetical protein